jgi:hypothetical protein
MMWALVLTISGSPTHPRWEYLPLCLAASAMALISSRQDAMLGAVIGSVFGYFMALFVLVAMTMKAAASGWWIEAVTGAAGLCAEVWLLKHRRFSRDS